MRCQQQAASLPQQSATPVRSATLRHSAVREIRKFERETTSGPRDPWDPCWDPWDLGPLTPLFPDHFVGTTPVGPHMGPQGPHIWDPSYIICSHHGLRLCDTAQGDSKERRHPAPMGPNWTPFPDHFVGTTHHILYAATTHVWWGD